MFLSILCLFTIMMTIKGLEGSKEKIQDNMVFPTTSKMEKPALRGNSCTLLLFYIQQEYENV